ncbi:MAG: tetratricopeptide repeat protein, partial [[Clostridium] symbiosum]
MGEAYRKQQQFARAVRFYQKAVQTCEAAHACGNAVFYSNLGRAYLAMGRKEESADAFYLSNRLFNDSAALIGRSITKGYVSILEAEKGNFSASR